MSVFRPETRADTGAFSQIVSICFFRRARSGGALPRPGAFRSCVTEFFTTPSIKRLIISGYKIVEIDRHPVNESVKIRNKKAGLTMSTMSFTVANKFCAVRVATMRRCRVLAALQFLCSPQRHPIAPSGHSMCASLSIKAAAIIGLGLMALIALGLIAFRSIEEYRTADQEVRRLLAVRELLETVRLESERAEVVHLRFELKTLGIFAATALAEIAGCYLPFAVCLAQAKRIAVAAGARRRIACAFRLAAEPASCGCRPRLRRLWRGLCGGGGVLALGCRWNTAHRLGSSGCPGLFSRHGDYHVCPASRLKAIDSAKGLSHTPAIVGLVPTAAPKSRMATIRLERRSSTGGSEKNGRNTSGEFNNLPASSYPPIRQEALIVRFATYLFSTCADR